MTSVQPPGWLPDPAGCHEFRWWSGSDWTEHVADSGQAHRDPLAPSAPVPGSQGRAPHPFDALTAPAVSRSRALPHPVANWVHAALVVLSCGFWAALLPSVYLWRRQSRPVAVLTAAISVGLVLGIAAMFSPKPPVAAPRYTLSPQDRTPATEVLDPLATATLATSTPAATGSPAAQVTPRTKGTIQPVAEVPASRAPKPARPVTARPAPTTPRPDPVVTTQEPPPPGPKDYANCAELNADYPHGVGLPGALDATRNGTPPVTTFTVDGAVYSANSTSDGDGDGVACERA